MKLVPSSRTRTAAVVASAAVIALSAGSGAVAAGLVTSADIKDGAVHGKDLHSTLLDKVKQADLAGSVYRIAHYSGGANGGAIATVACADTEAKSQKYVAISGGVQILDADGDHDPADDSNVAVADSFPGRMDWDVTSPKPNRLDGWIVRFGDNSKSAAQINVWAVCVKRPADLRVQTTDY